MALFVVRKRNPFGQHYRPGTFVECYDDGCRAVDVTTDPETHRMKVVKEKGVLLLKEQLSPFMSQVLGKGFDK